MSVKLVHRHIRLRVLTTLGQTCVGILAVGYILMQVPSNLFLQRLGKPAIYLPTVMVIWGFISAATAATRNFTGLLICRFLLGFVEAAYFVCPFRYTTLSGEDQRPSKLFQTSNMPPHCFELWYL